MDAESGGSEVRTMRKCDHKNICKLKEAFKRKGILYLVYEKLDSFYDEFQNKTSPYEEKEIKSIIFQVLHGLKYIHKLGIVHQDLRLEKLLKDGDKIKISGMRLARRISDGENVWNYTLPRWCQAPEFAFELETTSTPVDIFSLGCIMAELFSKYPLFPGHSSDDQIVCICSVLGLPTEDDWLEGYNALKKLNAYFPKCMKNGKPSEPLESKVPTASPEALEVMQQMLILNPSVRPSAEELINHSYFDEVREEFGDDGDYQE